jgi:hypothetical protein
VISELKSAGASWIQLDEPTLVMDLDSHKLKAFTDAYSELESSFSGLNVLIETYFADIPAEAYKTLTSLKGVTAFGFDLVRGSKTLDLIKGEFPKGKYLFAGVVDGRNIWANDLVASLGTLKALEGIVGKGTHFVIQKKNIAENENAPKVYYNVTFLKKIFAPTRIGMQQDYNKFFSKIQWSLETFNTNIKTQKYPQILKTKKERIILILKKFRQEY